MKKHVLPIFFLLLFCFSGFGQVDSVAMREVDSLVQVSGALAGKRDFDQALAVSAAAEKIALEKLGRESASYGKCCHLHGRILFNKSDFPEAEKWYLDAIDIRGKVLGKEHPDYAASLNNLGILYRNTGDADKAKPLYLEALAIREKALGKEHADYAWSLNNLANLYLDLSNYGEAEPLHLQAKAIREKLFGKEHPDYASSLNNLAIVYFRMGNYELAIPLFLEAKTIREKKLGKANPDYAGILINLANIYLELGNYDEAEQHYLEAKEIFEVVLNDRKHPFYSTCLNNLANLYLELGNFEKAEPLYLQAATEQEKEEKESAGYCGSLINLARLYDEMGDYAQAERLLLEAKEIFEVRLNDRIHTYYLVCLNNLGGLYYDQGNDEKAKPLYLEAAAIREKELGKEHPDYAESLINLGNLHYRLSEYDLALPLYIEALAIREKVFGKVHPQYVQSLNNLANLYSKMGNYENAGQLFNELATVNQSLLASASHYLSERELTGYLSTFLKYQNRTLSFIYQSGSKKVVPTCYDNTLFYKGFLLNAAGQVKRLAHSDSVATEKFNRLKGYERRLAAEYALPVAERQSVEDLEAQANIFEKDLARTVAGFGEALRQVTWQDVQAALQPGEAAIEFISFLYHNDPAPADSIFYAALLLKPGMETPAFIPLFEEKQLETLLAPLVGQGSDGLNELYGGQAGASLYQLLWSPLEVHLEGVKTIYFSPAGLLHRLNLDAIPVDEKSNLSDHFNVVVLGSTRQLVVGNLTEVTANTDAAIFGGIQFEMDSTAISSSEPDDFDSRRGYVFNQTDSTLRGDTWKYLKWSEKEADNIGTLLQKAGIQATVSKGYAATEESFKWLGRDKPSPRILHVSTHGFFFPDPMNRDEGRGVRDEDEPVFKMSDHPMMRAGLIFAGANHAWQTGNPLGNREDGILTAYEISQMNLAGTELVVLSACETGLGDIEGNEGVYGLQRAFKIAGAKYLIMSLWQVPDFQTQELMTVFYQKWLEEKMTLRQALKAAQEEMRKKRYEPFYWAGFVLVE